MFGAGINYFGEIEGPLKRQQKKGISIKNRAYIITYDYWDIQQGYSHVMLA